MTVTRPVLRYYGGKWKFASWIISFFPQHRTYCEVFGGAGSVLLRKPRSHYEVYNDIDDELVNLFRVLQDKKQSGELIRLLKLTPLARAEYEQAFEIIEDPVERARRTIIRSHMGFNGIAVNENNTTGFRCSLRETGSHGQAWANYPKSLWQVVNRLTEVVIENQPWENIIETYDRPDTLFYMDPPYFPSARGDWKGKVSEGAYRHEMSTSDHSHFLHTVKQIKGMVIISGYRCPMYNGQLSDWDSVDMKTKGTANASLRTETLWFNPKLQAARLPLLNMEVNL